MYNGIGRPPLKEGERLSTTAFSADTERIEIYAETADRLGVNRSRLFRFLVDKCLPMVDRDNRSGELVLRSRKRG